MGRARLPGAQRGRQTLAQRVELAQAGPRVVGAIAALPTRASAARTGVRMPRRISSSSAFPNATGFAASGSPPRRAARRARTARRRALERLARERLRRARRAAENARSSSRARPRLLGQEREVRLAGLVGRAQRARLGARSSRALEVVEEARRPARPAARRARGRTRCRRGRARRRVAAQHVLPPAAGAAARAPGSSAPPGSAGATLR